MHSQIAQTNRTAATAAESTIALAPRDVGANRRQLCHPVGWFVVRTTMEPGPRSQRCRYPRKPSPT